MSTLYEGEFTGKGGDRRRLAVGLAGNCWGRPPAMEAGKRMAMTALLNGLVDPGIVAMVVSGPADLNGFVFRYRVSWEPAAEVVRDEAPC